MISTSGYNSGKVDGVGFSIVCDREGREESEGCFRRLGEDLEDVNNSDKIGTRIGGLNTNISTIPKNSFLIRDICI